MNVTSVTPKGSVRTAVMPGMVAARPTLSNNPNGCWGVLSLPPYHMGKGLSVCIGGPHRVGAKSFPPAIFPEVGRAGGCAIVMSAMASTSVLTPISGRTEGGLAVWQAF